MELKFQAVILQNENMDAAYVEVPYDIKELFGKGRLLIVGSVFTGFRALRDKYYTAWISPEESCDALLYFDLMTPVRKAD